LITEHKCVAIDVTEQYSLCHIFRNF